MFRSVAICSPFSPGSAQCRAVVGVLASGLLYLACGSSAVVAQQLSWDEWNEDSENAATAAHDTRDSGPGFSDEAVSELRVLVNGIRATSSHKPRPAKATAVGLTRILEETPLAPQQELESQTSPRRRLAHLPSGGKLLSKANCVHRRRPSISRLKRCWFRHWITRARSRSILTYP